jgi:hypothetical protein
VPSPVGDEIDRSAGAGRLDDGVHHLEGREAVPAAADRFRLTSDDGGEVLDLVGQRVAALEGDRGRVERLPPGRRPGVYVVFSSDVCSQERGDAAVSESRNVPSAPLANVNTMAAVSSTWKPRVAFEVVACTRTTSPTRDCRLFTSWMRLSRIGPPPGCRRQPPPTSK